ncbi:NfeD family protein [Lysobacter korlensis]|uniref:NfeD family protein n=1 Tax=Lysobacter korlensis TaxID=553636 RepID=A0ABV6RMV1_9GAMM
MTRPVRIHLFFMPLAAAAVVFLGLGWFIPAALFAAGAVVVLVMSRRAVRTQFKDDAIRNNDLLDGDKP